MGYSDAMSKSEKDLFNQAFTLANFDIYRDAIFQR